MISQPNWISPTYFTISSQRMKDLCSTYRALFLGTNFKLNWTSLSNIFLTIKTLAKIWQSSCLTISLFLGLKIFVSLLKYILCTANKYKRRNGYPITSRSKYKHNFGFPVYGSLHKCEFALCVTQWDKWSRSFWLLLFWPLRSFKNSLVCNF